MVIEGMKYEKAVSGGKSCLRDMCEERIYSKDYYSAVTEQGQENNGERMELRCSPSAEDTEESARYILTLCPMQSDGKSLFPPVGKLFLLMTR
jgi:hypothetical protein